MYYRNNEHIRYFQLQTYQTLQEEVSEICNKISISLIHLYTGVQSYFTSSLIESKSETFGLRYW